MTFYLSACRRCVKGRANELRAPGCCLGSAEQNDSNSASQEADRACKHYEASVVVIRQAGVDLEHFVPDLPRGSNVTTLSFLIS
jgi:hypothetical protein